MELVTQTINSLTLGSDDDGTADDGTASNGADIENGRRHGGGHGSSHDHGRPCAGTGLDPSAPLVSAVIKMNIESSTTVEAEMAWIQGIGEALAQVRATTPDAGCPHRGPMLAVSTSPHSLVCAHSNPHRSTLTTHHQLPTASI
mmetsp:Transcript_42794/g.114939  ORF Transcript_42794/g.114939 Transcript_42794/m.114939 type:complete len:144 (-) Transcript_42794:2103-2534(-)